MNIEDSSLLLKDLDRPIPREVLEEASVSVPSIARADAARIEEHQQGGILVSHLPRPEALAFQRALAKLGHDTEVVADRDMPKLHDSRQVQRIGLRGESLVLTDGMGRERVRAVADLVFLAAGFHHKVEGRTHVESHFDFSGGVTGEEAPKWVTTREYREEEVSLFRVDFFFWSEPNRLHAPLAGETVVFFQNKALRLRDRDGIAEVIRSLGGLLPPQRLNSVLASRTAGAPFPSLASYENEIRWRFHRLKTGA